MRAKVSAVLPVIVLALASCTQGSGVATDQARSESEIPGPPLRVLVLGTDRGPAVVGIAGSSQLFEGAVAAPDGSRLYRASSDGRRTALETVDAATGEVVTSTGVRGDLDVRVVAESGRLAALMEPLPNGTQTWTPIPRSRTTIVVADPSGAEAPQRFRLQGNFEPEAFSVDDSRLFLIQYLPAETPAAYRVTVLDLAEGTVGFVHGKFDAPPERMPGIRLRQVFDPKTAQLYTLYSTEPEAYTESYGTWDQGDEPETFVHVLNLQRGWAYCAGLPKQFWGQPAGAQAMDESPDGTLLYLVDSMRGVVSVMDTRTLEILRTAPIDLGSVEGVRTSAQVSSDGDTLFVGSAKDGAAVYAIDTGTLEPIARWPVGSDVSGLGLSEDGLRLYVAMADRVAVLDAATGATLASVPFSGATSVLEVPAG